MSDVLQSKFLKGIILFSKFTHVGERLDKNLKTDTYILNV